MILRTVECPDCSLQLEIMLQADEWDAEPPECPRCAAATQQVFKPFAIGSLRSKAVKIAEKIATEDYGLTDMNPTGRPGEPAVKAPSSSWINAQQGLQGIVPNAGRAAEVSTDLRGEGFAPIRELKQGIRSGALPDVIANSRKQSIKVW